MLEGCSQCCVTFVRIVLSVPCWHAYHPWSGSRPTWRQRIVPVSEWYPRVCLHTWQWQGDKTLCDLWPCKPGLPFGFLSTVGEVWSYVAAGECVKEQHSFGNLRTWCNGNLMDRGVSEILTCSKCYSELLNVCKPWKWATPATTTSVPTVLMVTDFKPQFIGSLTWRSIRMYASSCEHGWSPSVFWHSCPRNRKSSSSCHHFVGSLFFQFPGSLAWLDTRLRVPVHLFALVAQVSDGPSCIHPRRDPRVGFTQFQKHTWYEYDHFLFGEGFRFPIWRNMHNTIQDCYFHMQGILVTA